MPPAPSPSGRMDRIAGLREIARRLRSAPDDPRTLQYIVDQACACTGATAGRLEVLVPEQRVFAHGAVLGAGPRVQSDLKLEGHKLGVLELTRMSDDGGFDVEDESFVELVADYLARATSGVNEGTALDPSAREFVDSVTEELRSPLTTVGSLLDSLLRGQAGDVSDVQRTYLLKAAEQNSRMSSLADDLLTLARLRPPRPRELDSVSLGPLVAGCVERKRYDAEARDIEIDLVEPSEPVFVSIVSELMEKAISHVLDNAIKFSHPGGRVEVTVMRFASVARITVKDRGIGFDRADATRIFGRFERAGGAEEARIPGAGLGLAIVGEVVGVHGGRAWAEHHAEAGTEVFVTLPLAE